MMTFQDICVRRIKSLVTYTCHWSECVAHISQWVGFLMGVRYLNIDYGTSPFLKQPKIFPCGILQRGDHQLIFPMNL